MSRSPNMALDGISMREQVGEVALSMDTVNYHLGNKKDLPAQ